MTIDTETANSSTTAKLVIPTDPTSIWIEDAKTQFLKLWSVRFSLMIAIFGAIQTGMAVYTDESPWASVITVVLGIVTAVSRVIKQPKLRAINGWQVTDSAPLE